MRSLELEMTQVLESIDRHLEVLTERRRRLAHQSAATPIDLESARALLHDIAPFEPDEDALLLLADEGWPRNVVSPQEWDQSVRSNRLDPFWQASENGRRMTIWTSGPDFSPTHATYHLGNDRVVVFTTSPEGP